MASTSAVHFAGGGVTLGLSFVGLRRWDLGLVRGQVFATWIDLGALGNRGDRHGRHWGVVCFRPSFRDGSTGEGELRGDAGVGAPVVVVLRELRRDDIAEHVRRARSEHLREGRDRPRHLRAERREGRHGDQGIFHPQSALLGNPGFVNGARVRVGPRSGPVRRCAGGFTRAIRSARVARYPSKRPTVPEASITARGRLQPAPYQ